MWHFDDVVTSAWWQEIASSLLSALLCGAGRLKKLRLKKNCSNCSTSRNIAVQYCNDHCKRVYLIFLWERTFRSSLFFIVHVPHISFASSTQGMISPLLLGQMNTETEWNFFQTNSLSFNFYIEFFQATYGIFPIEFSHVFPIKLQIKSPKPLYDFQNHSLGAVTPIMISVNWVHQFPIQYVFYLPVKDKSGLFSSVVRFASHDMLWHIGKVWILKEGSR